MTAVSGFVGCQSRVAGTDGDPALEARVRETDVLIEGVIFLDKPQGALMLFHAVSRTNSRWTNSQTGQAKPEPQPAQTRPVVHRAAHTWRVDKPPATWTPLLSSKQLSAGRR